LLQLWAAIDVADALKLLGPEKAFQHEVVRAFAVRPRRSAGLRRHIPKTVRSCRWRL
jgi:hypothetical protein